MRSVLQQLTDVPPGVQGLAASRTLTADDYTRGVAPLLDQLRTAGGRMRLLYQFGPDFERITLDWGG